MRAITLMDNELDRLSGVIDDLTAERDPAARRDLSADEAKLAATAAMLRGAVGSRLEPRDEFVDGLQRRLAARGSVNEAPQPQERHGGISRRRALRNAAAAVAGLAVGGAGITAAYERGKSDGSHDEVVSALQAPMVPHDRGSWQQTGHTLASVPAGSAVRFSAGALVGYLVNPGTGRDLYALSAVCTHMGCLLSWMKDAGTFLCPCHGAQYSANGTVLSGIPRHPLPRLQIKVWADGAIYVWSVGEHPAITTVAPYTQE